MTLTLYLECVWTHITVCDFSWGTLSLIGFFDRDLDCNLPWQEVLPPGITYFFDGGETDCNEIVPYFDNDACAY